MSTSPPTRNHQPDLRHVVASSINELAREHPNFAKDSGLDDPVSLTAEDVTTICQRTWREINTINTEIDGADVSACFANVNHDGDIRSWFFLACLPVGDTEWRPMGSQGGMSRSDSQRDTGAITGSRSHVCTCAINVIPDGGRIQVELADGTSYHDEAVDGCCIVFAPITTPPTPDDRFTIRYLDPDGNELLSETRWIGDGAPPPAVHPAS